MSTNGASLFTIMNKYLIVDQIWLGKVSRLHYFPDRSCLSLPRYQTFHSLITIVYRKLKGLYMPISGLTKSKVYSSHNYKVSDHNF